MEEVRSILEMFKHKEFQDYLKNNLSYKTRPIYQDVEDSLQKAKDNKDARAVFKFTQLKKQLQPSKNIFQSIYHKKYIVTLPERLIISNSPKSNKQSVKENAIEYILKNLPFKIYDQCISKQRSKNYYISKENLVKHISNTPELKHFFKNIDYKKQSKEDICKVFFDKN